MSWSFQAVGKVDAVKRQINTLSRGLTDQSKTEWEEVKPAIFALISANMDHLAVRVVASGHASFELKDDGELVKTSSQCSCVIEPLYGFVE